MSRSHHAFSALGGKDNSEFLEDDERAAPGFRHRVQNVPEEDEGLTEAFQARLGLIKNGDIKTAAEVHEIEAMNEVEKEATLSKFKFDKFMEEFYKSKCMNFIKEPIKEPLLSHNYNTNAGNDTSALSGVVISHAIKHFCKDISLNNKPQPYNCDTIITRVYHNLELLDKMESTKEEIKNKRMTVLKIFQNKQKNEDKRLPLDQLIETIPSTDLETAQFIISYGLLKRSLRDEIYCQLCSQVTKNPSNESLTRGWILHVLCAGCFMPTSKLLRYYVSFLKNVTDSVAQEYAKQSLTLLYRINSFGMRFHPPNSLEFLAIKSRKKIMLPVSLADGSVVPVLADSATTASEMCHTIYEKIDLKDQFGFAIYISVAGKASSLGNGLDHLMDAIGECEQVLRKERAREKEKQSQQAAAGWQLSFGKELFTPWHDAEVDQKSSDLIYKQICRSVDIGEFTFKSDEDMARFLARRCYVDFGPDLNRKDLKSRVKDMVMVPKPISGRDNLSKERWLDLVFSALEKMDLRNKEFSQLQVMWSIVEGAQRKWPLQFSALFEVFKVAGPLVSSDELIVAISCRGIFLLQDPYKLVHRLHYYDIVEVASSRSTKERGPSFQVTTIKGDEWVFVSPNSETITKILCTFLDGLRRRSKWAVAIEEFILRDHSKDKADDFHFRHGDVLELLDEAEQTHLKEDWMFGKCERTGKSGPFPFDSIYIFPTSEKPPKSCLNLFSGMNKRDFSTLPRKRGAIVLGKNTLSKTQGFGVQSAI